MNREPQTNKGDAMTTTIGNTTLTTDHPASSHNQPVLVITGTGYGPEDNLGGMMAGAVMVCSDVVCGGHRLGQPAIAALCQWLRQSPTNGMRWRDEVLRAQTAGRSEFADEQ